MAGPGIRYWEMAHELSRRGHRVTILTRRREKGFSHPSLEVKDASLLNLLACIFRADLIIQPGAPLSVLLSIASGKRLYFDLYDPVIFEYLEKHDATPRARRKTRTMLMLWRIRQWLMLRFGDAFLVANDKQKDLVLGQLSVLGRYAKFNSVITLPFGLPNSRPEKTCSVLRGGRIKESDLLIVWGGGIWGWFDPFTLLHALARIKRQRDDIKVYFPGVTPPSPEANQMSILDAFLAEAGRLGLLESTVFVNREWTPYERRADYLLEADIGISLHHDTMETRFAFRTRMLDYLWAGLPIIASRGDSWADVIDKKELGLTIPCDDVDALAHAILTLADDPELRRRCAENVRGVAEEYQWDRLVAGLAV